jgi:hypothetical protein
MCRAVGDANLEMRCWLRAHDFAELGAPSLGGPALRHAASKVPRAFSSDEMLHRAFGHAVKQMASAALLGCSDMPLAL